MRMFDDLILHGRAISLRCPLAQSMPALYYSGFTLLAASLTSRLESTATPVVTTASVVVCEALGCSMLQLFQHAQQTQCEVDAR